MKDKEEVLLIVKKFEYKDPKDAEAMNNEPISGRVYNAQYIKPLDGFRIYIGRDNNNKDLDGIFITQLLGNSSTWEWELDILDEDNLIDYDIHKDDYDKIAKWISDDKKSDVFDDNMLDESSNDIESIISSMMGENTLDDQKLTDALNVIYDKDFNFFSSLYNLIIYLSSTYSDKYAKSEVPTNDILYGKHLGKGFNMGNAAKYISRYCTEGFEKSNNTNDLEKSIHYLLFELTRRKING